MSAARAIPPGASTRGIADVLADARAQLHRVDPVEAARRIATGAVLVDIRPERQRATCGEVPGALVVERNVLEWRFDPTSDARLSAASYDLEILVLCQEGFTSSLAAAALVNLGIHRATDVVGGFAAWQAAGLPWGTTVSPTVDQLFPDGPTH